MHWRDLLRWASTAALLLLLVYVAFQYVTPRPVAQSAVNPAVGASGVQDIRLPAGHSSARADQSDPLPSSHNPPLTPPLAPSAPAKVQAAASIGSEGYGPHVLRALDQGSPADALRAAHAISLCRDVERDIARVYALRDAEKNPKRTPAWIQTIEWLQSEQRRCQTVTPAIDALKRPLLLKAAQHGALGAAASYAADLAPQDQVPPVIVEALKRDAEAGHDLALMTLAATPSRWGLGDEDAGVYREAWRQTTAKDPQRQQGFGQLLHDLLGSELPMSKSPRVQAIVEAQLRHKQRAQR